MRECAQLVRSGSRGTFFRFERCPLPLKEFFKRTRRILPRRPLGSRRGIKKGSLLPFPWAETNPRGGGSTFRKQSRLTARCRPPATQFDVYVHVPAALCGAYQDLAEIESAAVGGICKRERESTVRSIATVPPLADASLLKIISFRSDKLARIAA